jgi:hypothetical protein
VATACGAMKAVEQTEHELPCGHVLATAAVLDRITGFTSVHLWGSGKCPVCGAEWSVEFARLAASDGTYEWQDTYMSTGHLEGGPGVYFVPHQRRRVRGLVVDGSVARLGLREWQLPTRS